MRHLGSREQKPYDADDTVPSNRDMAWNDMTGQQCVQLHVKSGR